MHTVTSRDGTRIAFERVGAGPPVIVATGAFNEHHTGTPLAAELAADHTVVTYDRRARGESGDTAPYAVEREVEDLAALIAEVGGSAAVFGFSSGGVLALKAAADGAAITRLVLYEAPFRFDPAQRAPAGLPDRLAALVAEGRRGDAVALFQTEGIGLPADLVAQLRQSPMFAALEGLAQSTVYDATLTTTYAVPSAEMLAVTTPTLVLTGEQTWPILREAAQTLVGLLPAARSADVPGGANHDIPAAATATLVRKFLTR